MRYLCPPRVIIRAECSEYRYYALCDETYAMLSKDDGPVYDRFHTAVDRQ